MENMEIERKFLMPMNFTCDYPVIVREHDEQLYLAHTPEVRIRKITRISDEGLAYLLTFKSKGSLTRSEINISIDAEQYEVLKSMAPGTPIIKNVTIYQLDEHHSFVYSIVDAGISGAFAYGEIEYESETDSEEYSIPVPVGREVTYDSRYKMKNYWYNNHFNK